jgi:hypothetical protein
MFSLLLAAGLRLWDVDLWHALPPILAISLVYAATRHEQMGVILRHAARVALWIIGFMAVVFGAITFVSWLL